MGTKIPDLTGCIATPAQPQAAPEKGANQAVVERLLGIVDETPGPRASVPRPRQIAVPPPLPFHSSFVIDRLFAAVGRVWRRVWNPKLVGERAELLFMYEAARRGLIVSKPFGDSAPYDAIVESPRRPHRLLRIQVRSASVEVNGAYIVSTTKSSKGSRVITVDDADFFAVHITPHNAWYIVPVPAYRGKGAMCFHPHNRTRGTSSALYEKYREAWGLIGAGRAT